MKELKIKVPYLSIWDGGTEIVTSANFLIGTGEVTDIEIADTSNGLQICEREYIILNGEQIDIFCDDNNRYWVQSNEFIDQCSDNYLEQRVVMSNLSIVSIIRAVDYIVALSQHIEKDNEVLDNMDDITEPLNNAITKLRISEICRHRDCGGYLYKSDLPQYEFVCPNCDENF